MADQINNLFSKPDETITAWISKNRLAIALIFLCYATVRLASHNIENWYEDQLGVNLETAQKKRQELPEQNLEYRQAQISHEVDDILFRMETRYKYILQHTVLPGLNTNDLKSKRLYEVLDIVRTNLSITLELDANFQTYRAALRRHRNRHPRAHCENEEYIADSLLFAELHSYLVGHFEQYRFTSEEAAIIVRRFQLPSSSLDIYPGSREIYLKQIIREGQRHGDVRGRLLGLLSNKDWRNRNAYQAYARLPTEFQAIVRRMFCDENLALRVGEYCRDFIENTSHTNK